MRVNIEKVVERLGRKKFSDKVFNSELVSETLEKKKMSQSDLANILDLDFTTISGWITYKTMPNEVRVAEMSKVLGIPESSLVLKGEKAKEYKDNIIKMLDETAKSENSEEQEISEEQSNPIEVDKGATEKQEVQKFKKINSSRVDDCFRTINENVLLLASTLLRGAYENSKSVEMTLNEILSKQNDLMSVCCDILSRIDSLEKKESVVVKRVEESVEFPIKVPDNVVNSVEVLSIGDEKSVIKYKYESDIKSLVQGYSPDLDYKKFRSNIMRMAKIYSDIMGITSNNALQEVYKKMTRVYGIVFMQLKKEYKEKYGSTAPSTITAVYDNEMYRSIMYSILSDMVGNAVKEAEVV